MAANPRANNLDADNVQIHVCPQLPTPFAMAYLPLIQCQDLDRRVFANPLVVDDSSGADARGVGPAAVYLYRFHDVANEPLPDNVQVG
jgi:hypothetical protein